MSDATQRRLDEISRSLMALTQANLEGGVPGGDYLTQEMLLLEEFDRLVGRSEPPGEPSPSNAPGFGGPGRPRSGSAPDRRASFPRQLIPPARPAALPAPPPWAEPGPDV